MAGSLRHIALFVADLCQAEVYYQSLFGMELIGRQLMQKRGWTSRVAWASVTRTRSPGRFRFRELSFEPEETMPAAGLNCDWWG